MVAVKVNICTDLSLGVLTHMALCPPPIPVPVPTISIEMVVNQDWPPGSLNKQHKRTSTVEHKTRKIVQEGHDCGVLIPDVTPMFIANIWYIIMWPFSKRKILFSASSVHADGLPVGCAALFLPMMTCGEPLTMPTTLTPSSMMNTVEVEMTGRDLLIGLLYAVVSIAIEWIINRVGGKNTGRQLADSIRRSALVAASQAATSKTVTRTVGLKLIDKILGFNDRRTLAKRVLLVAAETGVARARAGASGASDPNAIVVKHTVGVPFANVTGTATSSADRLRLEGSGLAGRHRGSTSTTLVSTPRDAAGDTSAHERSGGGGAQD